MDKNYSLDKHFHIPPKNNLYNYSVEELVTCITHCY